MGVKGGVKNSGNYFAERNDEWILRGFPWGTQKCFGWLGVVLLYRGYLIHPEGELVEVFMLSCIGGLFLFHLLVCFSLCLLPWVSARMLVVLLPV